MSCSALRRVRWSVAAVAAMWSCLIVPRVAQAADPADIAALIAPSVVYIAVEGEGRPGATPGKGRVNGGSGLVVDADGHILTAEHVVAGQGDLRVTLDDGRVLPARLVGADKRQGVAVLRIQSSDLKPVKIADLRQLRLAERVLAVGRMPHSMGDGPVVTNGIISATDKGTVKLLGHIQTTAPLLPMMGGGGLFNERGELVGINSQVWKGENSGNAIVTFAIAIDGVLAVLPELIRAGKVARGSLGTSIDEVPSGLAALLGMPQAEGAFVRDIAPNGGAALAGVERGDVLIEIAGKPVKTAVDVPLILAQTKPGDRIVLKVFRRGTIRSLEAVTQEAPAS